MCLCLSSTITIHQRPRKPGNTIVNIISIDLVCDDEKRFTRRPSRYTKTANACSLLNRLKWDGFSPYRLLLHLQYVLHQTQDAWTYNKKTLRIVLRAHSSKPSFRHLHNQMVGESFFLRKRPTIPFHQLIDEWQ